MHLHKKREKLDVIFQALQNSMNVVLGYVSGRQSLLEQLFDTYGVGDISNMDMDFIPCQNPADNVAITNQRTPATYTDVTFVVDQTIDPNDTDKEKAMMAYAYSSYSIYSFILV